MDTATLQLAGAQPTNKQPKFAALGTKRLFTGLYTYRNPLQQPGSRSDERFYGGRPDALIDGLNVEISNKNTLIRRPGFASYTSASLPSPATSFYSFQPLVGSLNVYADTATGVYSLTPTTSTLLFTKSNGAGQTTFQGVGSQLFMGDGIDLKKLTGSTLTNWGIAPPATAPTLTITNGTANTTSTLGWSYAYCFLNSSTMHISTASPVSAYTSRHSSFQVTLHGSGSTDSQVDKIQIYRTTDGGATYLLLATIANPGSGSWNYTDNAADTALNTAIVAPQAMANNPPPAGLTNLTYYAGRLWGSVGNYVYYAAGPDCVNGSGNESWPPANYFAFPTQVTRLVPYANGLLVFTLDCIYQIGGNISAKGVGSVGGTVFYYTPFMSGIGVRSYNAVDTYGGVIYAYTSDCQVIAINPSAGGQSIGRPICDQLAGINPANASVAFLSAGVQDQALFVCDGSGNIWRCNPTQMPEGEACWSPKATVTGGASLVAAVETTVGVRQLMVASGTSVLVRSWNTYADNGTPYPAYATFGSIVLASPGQLADVQSITTEFKASGTQPTIWISPNEISGTFTQLANFVPDPPQLPPSQSVYSYRYYLNQASLPVVMQHLQFKIVFSTEAAANEMLGYSLYGQMHVD